jgi:hypothetical protein
MPTRYFTNKYAKRAGASGASVDDYSLNRGEADAFRHAGASADKVFDGAVNLHLRKRFNDEFVETFAVRSAREVANLVEWQHGKFDGLKNPANDAVQGLPHAHPFNEYFMDQYNNARGREIGLDVFRLWRASQATSSPISLEQAREMIDRRVVEALTRCRNSAETLGAGVLIPSDTRAVALRGRPRPLRLGDLLPPNSHFHV